MPKPSVNAPAKIAMITLRVAIPHPKVTLAGISRIGAGPVPASLESATIGAINAGMIATAV